MGHTPGPWEVSAYHRAILKSKISISGCSLTIAEMPMCAGPGFEKGFNESNAALIAAAPDLLEACENTVKMLTEIGTLLIKYGISEQICKDERLQNFIGDKHGKGSAIDKAQKAISKAKGGE